MNTSTFRGRQTVTIQVPTLEVGLALEITSQVAAGLEAVQEQNLVHRDIKPTNIIRVAKGRFRPLRSPKDSMTRLFAPQPGA
jgi:serine/threonine protein kinase